MTDLIIIFIILVLAVLASRVIIKRKGKCGSCHCDCKNCKKTL